MSTQRYRFILPWDEQLTIVADLAQAASPICWEDDEYQIHNTQYQTADACHCEWKALELVLSCLGRCHYADPDDDRDDDTILAEILRRTSLEHGDASDYDAPA